MFRSHPSAPGITLPLPFAADDGPGIEIAAPAPKTPPAPAWPQLAIPPAAPHLRWAAGLIDAGASLLLAAVFLLSAWAALGFPSLPAHWTTKATLRIFVPLLALTPAFWSAVLTWICFRFGAATPGMRRMGLRLVGFDGQPATRAARLKRARASLFSLGALGLGYAWMVLDPGQMTWHDHLSSTVVAQEPGTRG